jgi:hypothetical protein
MKFEDPPSKGFALANWEQLQYKTAKTIKDLQLSADEARIV